MQIFQALQTPSPLSESVSDDLSKFVLTTKDKVGYDVSYFTEGAASVSVVELLGGGSAINGDTPSSSSIKS